MEEDGVEGVIKLYLTNHTLPYQIHPCRQIRLHQVDLKLVMNELTLEMETESLAVARKIQTEYPHVPVTCLLLMESLENMLEELAVLRMVPV